VRTTFLTAVLALLTIGCGIDSDPAAPEDLGLTPPEPAVLPSEPEFATAATNVWTTKAPMRAARSVLVAGVVNGVLYAVGGSTEAGGAVATVEAYSPSSNSWTTKASLPSARNKANGAGVINGGLYVAGGENSGHTLTNTLYAYNPSTNTWATKAPMLKVGGCGASGVIGGKLYVYSGCGSPDVSFQRYDPGTNSWKALALPNWVHTFPAAGVTDGKFYLVGGYGDTHSSILEVYDPAGNTWAYGESGKLLAPRTGATGTMIDGLLYVVGGAAIGSDTLVRTAEVYDPAAESFRRIPSMPTPREELASGVLNGKLYAVGGYRDGDFAGTEVYTPGDVWAVKWSMPTPREAFAAAAVNGKFYAFGGLQNSSALATGHVYDAGTNKWTSRAALPQPRGSSNGAGVINGIVYVPGGHNGDGVYTRSLYAYNPSINAWSSKAPMPAAIGCGGSGVIGGKLYVYGTCGPDGMAQGGLYAYDPSTNSWGSRIASPVLQFPAVAAVNGKLYLAGGKTPTGAPSTAVNVYDPATGKWSSLPAMAVARYWAAAAAINGRLYVVGGYNGTDPLTTAEIYDPATAKWRTLAGMHMARWSSGAAAINGKLYTVGGNNGYATTTINEAYIP
jgi:N-acetylneuraminic acid mutarotase